MATQTQPQSQIRVKSYFATSLPAAIEMARVEMGPDAFLLNSRKAPPEARHLGPLEVVFGENVAPGASESVSATPEPPADRHMEDLGRKVDEIRNLLIKCGMNLSPGARLRAVERVLIDAGIVAELAREIDDAVAARASTRMMRDISRSDKQWETDYETLLWETIAELTERFHVRSNLGRMTALVGPPGSGKTTTLVKLAVSEGIMKGRSVRIISADWQRIAASEQLRIYAAILGASFQSADTISALSQTIDSAPPGALLLIDTPGLSPASMDSAAMDLAEVLRARQEIDTQLVLTATARPVDLANISKRFAVFAPAALIFTHLDETDSLSSVFSEAARSQIPVSFLCNGQLVPEDIRAANAHSVAETLVRHLPTVMRSAA